MVKSQFRFNEKKYTKNKLKQNTIQIFFCCILTAILIICTLICFFKYNSADKKFVGYLCLIAIPIPLTSYLIWLKIYVKHKMKTTFSKDFISTFCFYSLYFTHEITKNGNVCCNKYDYKNLKVWKHKEFFTLEYWDKENKIYFDDFVFFENIIKGDELKLEKTFREQGVLT